MTRTPLNPVDFCHCVQFELFPPLHYFYVFNADSDKCTEKYLEVVKVLNIYIHPTTPLKEKQQKTQTHDYM